MKRLASRRMTEGGAPDEKLRAIGAWIDGRLKLREADAYAWRNVDQLLSDGTYGSCADHSVLFGSLSRAVGIPTVWVKTMDADWIREFVRGDGKVTSWRGHVFLEVFIRGKWMLLDAIELTLQEDYDPRQRILPGGRYAYDKGAEPYSLVLSLRSELWRRQTAAYFRGFDLALLPVPPGDRLHDKNAAIGGAQLAPPVYVVADGPYYQWVVDRCLALGIPVGSSFNSDFDAQLARAVRHTLVVALVGDRLVLPEKYWPRTDRDLRRQPSAATGRDGRGRLRSPPRRRNACLRLYGRDREALRQMVDEFPP